MFREKKTALKDSIKEVVKKVTGDETESHVSPPNMTHQSKLSRGESITVDANHNMFTQLTRRGRKRSTVLNHGLTSSKKAADHSYAKEDDGLIFGRKRFKDKRLSVHFADDLTSTEAKVNFFRREIFDKKFRNLTPKIKKMLKSHYDELIVKRSKYRDKLQKKADLGKTIRKGKTRVKGFGPWDLLWEYKAEAIIKESPYNEFPSYRIRQVIVKGGDDLRQEIIAMQFIKKLQTIFKKEGASLVLRSYEIVVINSSSGIIGTCKLT